MKPNLFDFATKELSQDAFLAWLIQWASPECQNQDGLLSEWAGRFVIKLLSLQITAPTEITSVKAGRQWENIDVWAEVNNKYLLVIEDKIDTGEHSNQLQTYKQKADKWCVENKFQPVYVYLKTGSECVAVLQKIKQQGFAVLKRKDFLEILNNPRITNHIFNDFREHLQALEDVENQFSEKPVKEWRELDWKGFYQALEKRRPIDYWDWTNPPAGNGFWYAILSWYETKDCSPYLQIAQGPLCFKIEEVHENKSAIRNRYHELFMNFCAGKGKIRRPGRFGSGETMTIALVEQVDWLGSEDRIIDMDAVIKRLDDYERLYSDFVSKLNLQNGIVREQ